MRAADFQAALLSLIDFAEAVDQEKLAIYPVCKETPDSDSVRQGLCQRLNKLYHQILRDGRQFESLLLEAQHCVRKRLKRLRYLSEFVGPLFGEEATSRFLDKLVPAQDALGALNDQAVALNCYRHASDDDPHAWFASAGYRPTMPGALKTVIDSL